MWVEAVVSERDLAHVIEGMTPLTLRLGEGGRLDLSEPSEVRVLDDRGLELRCKAKLHWSLLGIHVPVSIPSVSLSVLPEVTHVDGAPCIAFVFQIEKAGIAGLLGLLDRRITDLVNRELRAKKAELSWRFGETLSHTFRLAASMRPLECLSLSAVEARVKAKGSALGLAVRFEADVARHRGDAELLALETESQRPRPPPNGT